MGKEDLDIKYVREGLEYRIEQFRGMQRPATPEPAYCAEMAETTVRLRREAIALMLMEADQAGFRDNLRRSAALRLDLLSWTSGRGLDRGLVRYIAGTQYRLGPFLDALAGGDMELATKVGAASTAPFDPRYEYEDDHLYGQILSELLASPGAAAPAIPSLLTRFEQVVEGGPSARLDVCRALLRNDREALAEGIAGLARDHEELFREKGDGMVADYDEFATERFIFVEGLAIKRIAIGLGIDVADEEPLMPREAFLAAV